MIILIILCIILCIISSISIYYGLTANKKVHKINTQVDAENQLLFNHRQELLDINKEIEKRIEENNNKITVISKDIDFSEKTLQDKQRQLEDIQNNISKTIDNQQELSQKAFKNYCDTLEKLYEEAEEEHNTEIENLNTAYSNLQLELIEKIGLVQKDLDQLETTRAAAIQAQIKEKEIAENKDNYRLNITEANQKDIRLLKSIQPDISNAIVIDKIIWSNYYQPLAKIKFPKIIGKATTCGIYKITSLITGLSYIGQSNDICDRWKQHCKNALGVGTVTTENKLYKAMKEEGLYNFTFEVLEECNKSLLDEKEKYYIKMYMAYDFGLNSNRGNN